MALAAMAPPSSETARFTEALGVLLRGAPAPWTVSIEDMRALRAAGKGVLPIHGPLQQASWIGFEPEALGPEAAPARDGPRRLRVIEPAGAARAVILHYHGGGWTFGAAEQCDGRNLRLARAADALVVSAPYRLGPEHRWPACADDALAAALWAAREAERRATPLFVMGESAGAHLAAATLLRLRDLGAADAVRGAVFIYGAFDLRLTPSARRWGERPLVLSTPIIEWFRENLLGPEAPALAETPEVSPLLADLAGMPPALFQVGAEDPLLDDTLFMAERWRAAGAAAELALWPGAPHAFDMFDAPEHQLPIARESQALSAAFITGLAHA